jgi:outer membrane protein assembly factor BamB
VRKGRRDSRLFAGVVSLALILLAGGCSLLPVSTRGGAAVPPQPRQEQARQARKVLVTVIDGDTGRRVRGARVSIGRRAGTTDGDGVAGVPVLRRAALPVTVSRRGYETRTVRLWFRQHPRSSLRVYQSQLQWPVYGASAARTQAPRAIRLRPPFRVVWSHGLGSLVEFPAVVQDGVAYVGNYQGTVYALDMRDGRTVWHYDPPGGKMASSPAVWRDALVVHGMDGVVRVLDRRSGRLRWRFVVGSPVESSPVIAHGLDFFGAWNGRVYALDLIHRRLRWTYLSGPKITSSAALEGGRLVIGDYGGRVLSLSQRTGRLAWVAGVNGRVYGTPAISGGRVFVPSSDGNSLTAFSLDGRYLWRRHAGGYVYSSPAVSGGRVVFGSYDGYLYCLSAASGRTVWLASAGGPVSGAAVVVAGVAYAGSTWGRITGVDVRTGRVLLRFPHGEYVPVSGNGGTLLLHGYSRIYAVKPR